jgi:hypothetical protein
MQARHIYGRFVHVSARRGWIFPSAELGLRFWAIGTNLILSDHLKPANGYDLKTG